MHTSHKELQQFVRDSLTIQEVLFLLINFEAIGVLTLHDKLIKCHPSNRVQSTDSIKVMASATMKLTRIHVFEALSFVCKLYSHEEDVRIIRSGNDMLISDFVIRTRALPSLFRAGN